MSSDLVRSYGTISFDILGNAENIESLGKDFGSGLYENEVNYLIQRRMVLELQMTFYSEDLNLDSKLFLRTQIKRLR